MCNDPETDYQRDQGVDSTGDGWQLAQVGPKAFGEGAGPGVDA